MQQNKVSVDQCDRRDDLFVIGYLNRKSQKYGNKYLDWKNVKKRQFLKVSHSTISKSDHHELRQPAV